MPLTPGTPIDLTAESHPAADAETNAAAIRAAINAEELRTAASQEEMEAGTETAIRSMTPERVAQAIAAQAVLTTAQTLTEPQKTAAKANIGLGPDDVVPVTGIVLEDTTGVAFEPGTLSLNASGEVVVHDDERNTESLPHLVDSNSVHLTRTLVGGLTMQNGSVTEISRIPLSPLMIADGVELALVGQLVVEWAAGGRPDTGVYLAIHAVGQDATADGYLFPLASTADGEHRGVLIKLLGSDTAGVVTFALSNVVPSMSVTHTITSGVAATVADWVKDTDVFPGNAITFPAGVASELVLSLVAFDATGTCVASIALYGNLSLIATL